MIPVTRIIPDDVAALRAALAAEQLARREAEAGASGAEAMVAHLELLIAKLRHEQFGASSERGRAAAVYALITTAKLNGVDPRAWLADVLRRIADYPVSRLDELLPWNYAQLAARLVA